MGINELLKKLVKLSVIAVLFIGAVTEISAEEKINDGDVILQIYNIQGVDFNEFVLNPSYEFLHNKCYKLKSYEEISEKPGVYKKNTVTVEGTTTVDEYEIYPHYKECGVSTYDLIELSRKHLILEFLEQNGIKGIIEISPVIDALYPSEIEIPPVIWIKNEEQNFFITINFLLRDDLNTVYWYQLYTHSQFKEKMSLKPGTLVINGEQISGDEYVRFQNGGVWIPFRTVMEKLGATVSWDADTNAVLIGYNGKRYYLQTKTRFSLYEEERPEKDFFAPPPGSTNPFSYQMINDRIFMDNKTMKMILLITGGKMEVDKENLIVTIY